MIEVKNVSMRYGPLLALDAVSFEVKSGEILGLLGPNGAGKSTLMKILTTILYPVQGTAVVEGHDILTDPLGVRNVVGYLPETVPLYLDMRVDEYLTFVGRARGVDGNRLAGRMEWLKDRCGLRKHWKHGIHELSKGYRQRVGLAQALIHDPPVLILDEVTTGLDPLQVVEIRQLIKDLARGKTIIFSTHILQEVDALADRIVIINEGRIIAHGTREELVKAAVRNPYYQLTVQAQTVDVQTALAHMRPDWEVTGLGESPDGMASVQIKGGLDDGDLWPEIDRLIKERNWPVKFFGRRVFNLEDVFIALLKQPRDMAAPEGRRESES